MFSYGAIDIDPKHLTVWVLLSGPEEGIPQWAFPPRAGQEWHLDEARWNEAQRALVPVLFEMAGDVRECFKRVRWPDADGVSVGFDSVDRAKRGGARTSSDSRGQRDPSNPTRTTGVHACSASIWRPERRSR